MWGVQARKWAEHQAEHVAKSATSAEAKLRKQQAKQLKRKRSLADEASAQLPEIDHVPQRAPLSTAAGAASEPEQSTGAGRPRIARVRVQGAYPSAPGGGGRVDGPIAGRSGAVGEGLGHSEGAAEGAEAETGARIVSEGGNENGTATGLGPMPSPGGPSAPGGASELHTLSPFASHVPGNPEIDGAPNSGGGSGGRRGGTLGRHAGGRGRGTARQATIQNAPTSTAPEMHGRSPGLSPRAQGPALRRHGKETAAPRIESTAESPALTSAGGWASDEVVRFYTLAAAAAASRPPPHTNPNLMFTQILGRSCAGFASHT